MSDHFALHVSRGECFGKEGEESGGWCSTRGDTALSQAPLSSIMCLLVMGTGAQFSLGRCYCWACLLCQVLPSLPKKEVGTRPSDIKRKEDRRRALAAQPAPCKSSETCPLPDRSSRRTAEDGSGWKRTFPPGRPHVTYQLCDLTSLREQF